LFERTMNSNNVEYGPHGFLLFLGLVIGTSDLISRGNQRSDTNDDRAVRLFAVVNRTGFDQAIDHSCWYMRQKGGMVRREHDCVSGRAFGAQRGQRAARGPDGIELVNLNRLFSPACFLHGLSPLLLDGLLPSLPADHIIGAISEVVLREAPLQLANGPTLVPAALKSLLGFLKFR